MWELIFLFIQNEGRELRASRIALKWADLYSLLKNIASKCLTAKVHKCNSRFLRNCMAFLFVLFFFLKGDGKESLGLTNNVVIVENLKQCKKMNREYSHMK